MTPISTLWTWHDPRKRSEISTEKLDSKNWIGNEIIILFGGFFIFEQHLKIKAIVALKRTGLFPFSLWIDCCYKTSFENQQYTAIDRKNANILFILLVLKRPSIQTICPNSEGWALNIRILNSKRVKVKLE